jgi:hypothetical protein
MVKSFVWKEHDKVGHKAFQMLDEDGDGVLSQKDLMAKLDEDTALDLLRASGGTRILHSEFIALMTDPSHLYDESIELFLDELQGLGPLTLTEIERVFNDQISRDVSTSLSEDMEQRFPFEEIRKVVLALCKK